MRHLLIRSLGVMLLLALCNAGCASVTRSVPIERPTGLAVTRWAELRLPPGTDSIVRLVSGETVRGTVESVSPDQLELRLRGETGAITQRRISHADIALVARVVRMSKGARGCLGAVIGAVASLPFTITMFGDMMVPAAIVGALIGRGTGDSHAEVVFERQQASPVR